MNRRGSLNLADSVPRARGFRERRHSRAYAWSGALAACAFEHGGRTFYGASILEV